MELSKREIEVLISALGNRIGVLLEIREKEFDAVGTSLDNLLLECAGLKEKLHNNINLNG